MLLLLRTPSGEGPAPVNVAADYFVGGRGFTSAGKLVVTTGDSAATHRVQGLLVSADGELLVATAGTAVGRVNGWEVDSDGRLLVDNSGSVADSSQGLPVNSSGRVVADSSADPSFWAGGLARTSDRKLAIQLNDS